MHKANTERTKQFSPLWLIPVLALRLISKGLFYIRAMIPGYTTTVQPPTTTKKDMSLIEFVTVSINNFRKEMINGNEILGIPKMEPWTFQKSNLDME